MLLIKQLLHYYWAFIFTVTVKKPWGGFLNRLFFIFCLTTVIGSQSGSLHSKWISQYLRHFSTEMAEIWSPGTFLKIFGHTKFQLSITFTFRVIQLLVKIDFHKKFHNFQHVVTSLRKEVIGKVARWSKRLIGRPLSTCANCLFLIIKSGTQNNLAASVLTFVSLIQHALLMTTLKEQWKGSYTFSVKVLKRIQRFLSQSFLFAPWMLSSKVHVEKIQRKICRF